MSGNKPKNPSGLGYILTVSGRKRAKLAGALKRRAEEVRALSHNTKEIWAARTGTGKKRVHLRSASLGNRGEVLTTKIGTEKEADDWGRRARKPGKIQRFLEKKNPGRSFSGHWGEMRKRERRRRALDVRIES